MLNGIFCIILLSYYFIHNTLAINFQGKTPPNSYIIPVSAGDVVMASANWISNATDLDLHLYQPGVIISDRQPNVCECYYFSSS